MAEPTFTLRSAWLRNRIAELGLKQWWLAEQLRVDRKTVLRWVNGQVRTIQRDNAVALAGILGCRLDDLELPRAGSDLATPQDQHEAGQLLATSRLLERLGPVGEWDVAESLIRAVAVPALPLHVLGELHNRLCVACWRQGKMAQADVANQVALELAERCGDNAVRAGALASRANLLHWRGDCAAAQQTYRQALALGAHLEPAARAGVHNNLGASLAECGDFEAGRAELQTALAELMWAGSAMQLSITRTHLAILHLRLGQPEAAASHADWARRHAEQTDYRRGLAMCQLLSADIAARRGRHNDALALLAQGLERFAALGIDEGLNHEFAARVQRQAGQLDAALLSLQRGLAVSHDFPLQHAELQLELVLLQRERGDGVAALEAQVAARTGFLACGAPVRADQAGSAISD
jgi:tetratricopeptide (TPR) repeat protein